MASQPQLFVNEVVTLVPVESATGQDQVLQLTGDFSKIQIRFSQTLPIAVGQDRPPSRPQSQIVSANYSGSEPLLASNRSKRNVSERSRTLELIAVVNAVLLFLPPIAVVCGADIFRCSLSELWFGVSYLLIATVCLRVRGRISGSDFFRLINCCLGALARPFEQKDK